MLFFFFDISTLLSLLFAIPLFTPAHAKQIQNGKQEKRRQRERRIGPKRIYQQHSRRQLDIAKRPAPAMSVELPCKGQARDGRHHGKDVRYSSREAASSGVGVVQRRIVYEIPAP